MLKLQMARILTGLVLLGASIVAAPSASAGLPPPGSNPDSPAATPVQQTRSGAAAASISRGDLCRRLRSHLARGGRRSGLFVLEAESGAVLCRKDSRTRRSLASNMKLFTTATALARFEPDQRIPTRLWRTGRLRAGVLYGNLWLVGGGDPSLGSPAFYEAYYGGLGTNLYSLVAAVRGAGIRRVTGRLYGDDTFFDRLRGVADSGYATSPYIGPLSALSFNAGYAGPTPRRFSSNPPRLAATKLAHALGRAGVRVREQVALRKLPESPSRDQIGVTLSPRMSVLVDLTNVYSNNFFAEMLLKRLGAKFGARGSTGAGATVVEKFARKHSSGVHAIDGSGLTATNRASPAEVGRLLESMRENYAGGRFVGSLAVAGREGTLAERMRGTTAEKRCRAKTGTIYGVSALSGYCFNRSGREMVFSILMNGVTDVYRARLAQDRMAALIARY